ncbi:DUF2846 domain-containing protein [Massilia sp. PAMC28688]|uniref:DUF2846 domain-containing protein n=1 Tax=Massilia sp. PAMC28688 TaxID=2861283 RepID=UPI001C628BE0|nr:DUF2846 domain-containing protein [Massilia sp. PAMC28688]QYF92852.1 DUF2846 domain-containing protein [Massilia sp. PAMC28688]
MHLIRLAPLAALLLAGCATHVPRAAAPAAVAVARVIPLADPQACSIVLYRGTALVGRLHPDAPVLYVDGQPIAPLKVGETLCVEVIDGRHDIVMRERRMTVPVGFSNSLPHKFPGTGPLYLHYGQAASGKSIVTFFEKSSAERYQARSQKTP